MKPLTTSILIACGFDREVEKYVPFLNELLPAYGITTLLRLAHFLGQVIVESDKGRAEHEYASGVAYENRTDLGNTSPGDGVKYRGRGGIECTGKFNYVAFGKKFGIDCVNHPELLEQPKWWVVSALWYWNSRNMNKIADRDDVLGCSQLVNQGSLAKPGTVRARLPNNYADRVAYVAKCKLALAPLFTSVPETA